jgi:hypothetical protein
MLNFERLDSSQLLKKLVHSPRPEIEQAEESTPIQAKWTPNKKR